jgi:hypothetical protein
MSTKGRILSCTIPGRGLLAPICQPDVTSVDRAKSAIVTLSPMTRPDSASGGLDSASSNLGHDALMFAR